MSEILFSSDGWTLKRESGLLPDGRVKTMVRAYTCDTVHILACPSPTTVLLLREFRPFAGGYVWMLPSGKMDKEADPLIAAQRELREETGFRAEVMEHFFSGRLAERLGYLCHIYLARDLQHDPLPQDETELIEVHELSLEEALEKVESGEVIHTLSALALHRLLSQQMHRTVEN